MNEYKVLKREVNIVTVKVRAESRDEAVQKVANYEGDEYATDYSHTLDTDTWSVEDSDGTEYYCNPATGKFDKTISPKRKEKEEEPE